jgi:hypothetical protein
MPVRPPAADRFQSIRRWEGRQDRAFEELCFQLRDPMPDGVALRKTRAPDAGVEWYWQFTDGHEEGWQAKFIFDSDTLIAAMGRSLDTVRDKRPAVRNLTFCLPEDLADDPSNSRGQQLRQRLDDAIVRWKERAPQITVAIQHGGELLERLLREEHRGREWFFFHERVLGRGWCAEALQATTDDAGDRYTPQQNVDLPIDRTLEATALSAGFVDSVRDRRDEVLLAARELFDERDDEAWRAEFAAARRALAAVEPAPLLNDIESTFDAAPLLAAVERSLSALEALDDVVRPIAWPPERQGVKPQRPTNPAEQAAQKAAELQRSRAQSLWRYSSRLQGRLLPLCSYLRGAATHGAQKQALFVTGPAGSGKTHLCCDVAERLLAEGHPVIVILGDKFRDPSPWETLARELGDPGLSPEEVATCLAASGEAAGRRALLVIDAVNESPDIGMWATDLADLRRRLSRTGWAGLAVTCRTTYVDLVEPPGGPDEEFTRIEHPGYRGREFEAAEQIFAANGVQAPRVPLLIPEFTNPLFLKLYCQGVAKERAVLAGTEHLSQVFAGFVANRAREIERKLRLDSNLELVTKAMNSVADRMAATGVEELAYAEAAELVNALAPHRTESPQTLAEAMVAGGLLAIERHYVPEAGKRQTFIAFPYQRFSDHLILRAFLYDRISESATTDEVAAVFTPGTALAEWVDDAPRGLIEALAVQLPERWGVELPYVVAQPSASEDWQARYAREVAWRAFATSLIVRDRRAFSPRTTDLVNDGLSLFPEAIFEALHTVAPDPDHPINALAMHDYLSSIPMAERDAWWTAEHYHAFGDPSRALDRLIRWAARGPYPDYPDDVIELAATMLAWIFASPNRFARDYTTKALATLLIGRLEVATRLVGRFAEVDDPYVIQRVAATCLGAVTRTPSEDPSAEAAVALFDALVTVVESEQTLPDVLLRDHVATLSWWLAERRLIGRTRRRRAHGPYGSRPPKTPRTKAYLEGAFPRSDEREQGYGSLLYSALSEHSDWSRYVVSGRVDDFLTMRLGETPAPEPPPEPEPTPRVDRKAWDRFLRSLDERQLQLLAEDPPNWDAMLPSLDDRQNALLDKVLVERRPPRRRVRRKPMAYPPERAARFVYQRCIELGWRPEMFGRFDDSAGRLDRGRDNHKAERFGKKYQWIAFHELLARLADNYAYSSWRQVVPYAAWRQNLRNLDPTLPPERIAVGEGQEYEHQPTFVPERRPTWWTTGEPDFGRLEPGREGAWAQRRDDLPTPEQVVRLTDQAGTDWTVIEGHRNWREDPFEFATLEKITAPERDLAILIGSTLIRQRDEGKLREWLADHPDLLRAFPDWHSQGTYEAYLAELPRAQDQFDHPGGWRPAHDWGRLPVRSAATSLGYTSEGNGFDCSLSDSATLEIPAKMLFDLAGMRWSEREVGWVDEDGRLIAAHRETAEGFHRDRVLMIAEDVLAEVLRQNELVLAVGLFTERRVFKRDSKHSMPDRLGWVDYVGHALFDGRTWSVRGLDPYDDRDR